MKNSRTVAFHTLGCKLNQAETEQLSLQFMNSGYCLADADTADVFVLNTCTVTHIADRKSRHIVRMIRHRNPGALIIAAGCYAQRAAGDLLKAGADITVDNENKKNIVSMINEKNLIQNTVLDRVDSSGFSRVRSFVKIQDGCRHFCTYCIVPVVRQVEYCFPLEQIISTIGDRVSAGYKEVVLTGTEIGRYRDGSVNLAQLISKILNDTAVERLHLSSLQPQEISEELLQLWQNSRLSRHFHLALQSGSDSVLKRMRREYDTEDYRHAVSIIRNYLPEAAITTDIMVGFPGESEQEFEESYSFCRDIGFAGIHVFSYSPRPGTAAAGMPEQVNDKIKKIRSRKMLDLSRRGARDYRSTYLDKTVQVLFENEVTPGSNMYSGLSENYIRVFARSTLPAAGTILPVKLIRHYHQDVLGEVVD
jgi:threonylcarbamoyladenosine tRNA methylthiotransferase MtaB